MNIKLKKIIPVLFWAFLLIYISYQCFIKPDHSSDENRQLISLFSFLDGNGFSNLQVNAEDISKTVYLKNLDFPIGLSVIMLPLINVFDDPMWIHNVLLFLMRISFFILFLLLLKRAAPAKNSYIVYLVALFVLFSTWLYGNYNSDLICLNLFIIATLYFSSRFKSLESIRLKHIFVLSFLCFLFGFFRYAYYPLCFVFSAIFIIFFLKQKKFRWLKIAAIHSIIIILLLTPQIIIQLSNPEALSRVAVTLEVVKMPIKYHLINLISSKPVFLSVFFDDIVLLRVLGYEGQIGYDRGFATPIFLRILLFTISSTILIIVTGYLYQLIKKNWRSNNLNEALIFLSLGLAMLIQYFFITWKGVSGSSIPGEYVINSSIFGRYYNIATLTTVVLIYVYLVRLSRPINILNKFLVILLSGVFLLNFTHKLYLASKYSFTDIQYNINLKRPPAYLLYDSNKLKNKINRDNTSYVAYVTNNKRWMVAETQMQHYIQFTGVPILIITGQELINSTKDVFILSDIPKEDLENKTNLQVIDLGEYYALAEKKYIVRKYKLLL